MKYKDGCDHCGDTTPEIQRRGSTMGGLTNLCQRCLETYRYFNKVPLHCEFCGELLTDGYLHSTLWKGFFLCRDCRMNVTKTTQDASNPTANYTTYSIHESYIEPDPKPKRFRLRRDGKQWKNVKA